MELVEIPINLLYLNTGMMAILFVVWTIKDTMNCIFKLVLFGVMAWNALYLLELFGYVVKAGGAG